MEHYPSFSSTPNQRATAFGSHLHLPQVQFVGAGPGDPELLTLKALRALETADVIIHDRLISDEILSLIRPEVTVICAGKEGFGPSTSQSDINLLITTQARPGTCVVRLKSGDSTLFGRLDEEIEACDAAGINWQIIPGITSASAAVAAIGQSLTKRSRNSSVRYLTGHDIKGFAVHDWSTLAQPGEVAAVYMGKKSARYVQGRLLMHGALAGTPVTIIENASRPEQVIIETTLSKLPADLTAANLTGPALLLFGLAPRAAVNSLTNLDKELA